MGKKYGYVGDPEIINGIQESKEVADMPKYPAKGYCKMVDGYLVIKF